MEPTKSQYTCDYKGKDTRYQVSQDFEAKFLYINCCWHFGKLPFFDIFASTASS